MKYLNTLTCSNCRNISIHIQNVQNTTLLIALGPLISDIAIRDTLKRSFLEVRILVVTLLGSLLRLNTLYYHTSTCAYAHFVLHTNPNILQNHNSTFIISIIIRGMHQSQSTFMYILNKILNNNLCC